MVYVKVYTTCLAKTSSYTPVHLDACQEHSQINVIMGCILRNYYRCVRQVKIWHLSLLIFQRMTEVILKARIIRTFHLKPAIFLFKFPATPDHLACQGHLQLCQSQNKAKAMCKTWTLQVSRNKML